MADQNSLEAGALVNIKRTDGRVHSAYVASVDYILKLVHVEWFELGETKGKEMDLGSISALNPDLVICLPTASEPIAPEPSTIEPVLLQRSTSRQITAPKFAASQRGGVNLRHTRYNTERLTEQPPNISENAIRPLASTIGSINNSASQPNHLSSSVSANSPTPTSNVVKQVEKLKKNREERRQRQAEERAEREAFLQLAPGNPHWELLNMIMEYRRGLDIRPLGVADSVEDHTITVCVRKRPINKKETNRKEVDVITIPSKNQLIVHEPKTKVDLTKFLENQVFKFDYAFDETCNNEMVYRYTAQPLVKTIFEGGFATCFAYGQTGSGKTHTMGGNFSASGKNQDAQSGIYSLAAADVFQLAGTPQNRHQDFVVAASFFEIYSGKVFDLLNNKRKLRILEDGRQNVVVVGLTEKAVTATDQVLELIRKGTQARTSGQTHANANSSRSHAVFQIIVRRLSNMQKVHGKFSLIDLAGNERGADTSSANRGTRMEGAEINKSLLALKECIRALGRKGGHLPFRVSKLTLVLRDSFVGANSRTCMIAMVSPGLASCEHTLNTLRYANRVKELSGGELIQGAREANGGDDDDDYHGDAAAETATDLQHLRSLSDHDMTLEMMNFHQVLSDLQQSEEQVLDQHRATIQQLKEAATLAERILKPTEDVTYDHEVYCTAFADLISKTMQCLQKSAEKVADYKAKLLVEEQVSRRTKL